MSRKLSLPFFEVFINYQHRILKMRATHRTSNWHPWILLMPSPYLKTFSMQTLLTRFTGRIAFSIHLLITNRTHRIVLKRRKIVNLLFVNWLDWLLELMFFDWIPLFLSKLKLNKPLQLRIEVRRYVVTYLPCHIMGLVGGTLNFLRRTYNECIQWSFCTIPHEHITVEPILTWIYWDILWTCCRYHP